METPPPQPRGRQVARAIRHEHFDRGGALSNRRRGTCQPAPPAHQPCHPTECAWSVCTIFMAPGYRGQMPWSLPNGLLSSRMRTEHRHDANDRPQPPVRAMTAWRNSPVRSAKHRVNGACGGRIVDSRQRGPRRGASLAGHRSAAAVGVSGTASGAAMRPRMSPPRHCTNQRRIAQQRPQAGNGRWAERHDDVHGAPVSGRVLLDAQGHREGIDHRRTHRVADRDRTARTASNSRSPSRATASWTAAERASDSRRLATRGCGAIRRFQRPRLRRAPHRDRPALGVLARHQQVFGEQRHVRSDLSGLLGIAFQA